MGERKPRKFRYGGSYNGLLSFAILVTVMGITSRWLKERRSSDDLGFSVEVEYLNCLVDSVHRAMEAVPQRVYPFNPNYIDEFKAYRLGLSAEEFERIRDYRLLGHWINNPEDFKRVSRIGDSLFVQLKPLLKFPYWVTDERVSGNKGEFHGSRVKVSEFDLNSCSAQQLRQVNGVGEVLSKRILDMRFKLGGFAHVDELYAVYGLGDEVISRIREVSFLSKPRKMTNMNINEVSASDVSTIPGISYEQARAIWQYRWQKQRINELSELAEIPQLGERQLRLIALYLRAE